MPGGGNLSYKFIDHSDEVNRQLDSAIEAALEAIWNQAVSHAKNNITEAGRVDTGALRNSISHHVEESEKAVYVGTNVEYAIYNEFGTGIYAEGGRGRKTPWSYVDAKGQGHYTHGMRPIHFLKRAAQDHAKEYISIAESILHKKMT